ncbi:hypothetical protein [Streptomyces hoynatensis]|uniref:Lipoprotein n=1 Tax=Streptomyces hoynatensis TaxID=1141874 RepID=A0A3A9ZIA8_9ACTN|nr:hypothetical protein [Streptomyces hoynatensis]RKN47087.1 hypothetical protein D7294_02605 [Streptomyces hoynatensis]
MGVACAGLLAAALAACGDDPDKGTNGIGRLSAEEIEQRARQAAEDASSVRLTGTVISDGASYDLDVRLGEEGAVGEVSSQGSEFQLLRIGEDLYIKADAAFWQSDAVPEELDSDPAQQLEGKYLRVAREDPAYEQLSTFTRMDVLDALLTLDGERETGDREEVGGVRAIRVEADGGQGGALDVSLIGTPYPLRLERGGDAGVLRLDDWDQELALEPPAEDEIVDYGEDMVTSAGE